MQDMFNKDINLTPSRKKYIHSWLKAGNKEVFDAISPIIEFLEDPDWKNEFQKDFEMFVEQKGKDDIDDDAIPF